MTEMHSLFLRFESQEQAEEVFEQYGIVADGTEYCIDVIGNLFEEVAEEEFEQVPGWHVNMLAKSPHGALMAYQVTPQQPTRVWM